MIIQALLRWKALLRLFWIVLVQERARLKQRAPVSECSSDLQFQCMSYYTKHRRRKKCLRIRLCKLTSSYLSMSRAALWSEQNRLNHEMQKCLIGNILCLGKGDQVSQEQKKYFTGTSCASSVWEQRSSLPSDLNMRHKHKAEYNVPLHFPSFDYGKNPFTLITQQHCRIHISVLVRSQRIQR